jgi:hypothetical protein
VSTHAHDILAPDPPISIDVQVICDPEGGWRINALRDGCVVDTRHSGDWHRVERACRALAAGPRPHAHASAGAQPPFAAAMTGTR